MGQNGGINEPTECYNKEVYGLFPSEQLNFFYFISEITKPINNNHVTRDTLRYLRKKLRQAVAGCIYV
jgi:hypothetical protein